MTQEASLSTTTTTTAAAAAAPSCVAAIASARPARADGTFDLLIERTFDAPASLVFRLWEERELMLRWWGPVGFTTSHLDHDFRVGGGYRACIVSPTGDASWMRGTFLEIARGAKIVMTFAWENCLDQPGVETVVTVTFEEVGGKTVQRFHQEAFALEAVRDSHVGGWSSFFEREASYVRGQEVAP